MSLTPLLYSRIPFLFSNAVALHIALTSPNGPPSQSEKDAAKYDRGEQIYAKIQTWLPLYNTVRNAFEHPPHVAHIEFCSC